MRETTPQPRKSMRERLREAEQSVEAADHRARLDFERAERAEAESRRSRAREKRLEERVAKLKGLLRRVPQIDCHPSEGRHSDFCKEIRAALSEET